MRVHLIASASCDSAATALHARIVAILAAGDACEIRSFACVARDEPAGDDRSPDLAIVMIDAATAKEIEAASMAMAAK